MIEVQGEEETFPTVCLGMSGEPLSRSGHFNEAR